MHRYFFSFFALDRWGRTAFSNCEMELDRPVTGLEGDHVGCVRTLERTIAQQLGLQSVTLLHWQRFEEPPKLVSPNGAALLGG